MEEPAQRKGKEFCVHALVGSPVTDVRMVSDSYVATEKVHTWLLVFIVVAIHALIFKLD